MPGKWDCSSKRLIGENPGQLIQWLLPDAQYQGVPKPKTPTMETKEIEADSNPSSSELLAVTYTLASLVFKKAADRSWLKRRFSMLDNHLFRDSWVYQELIQEGVEKGLQEGIEKERQQRLKDQRQMLKTLVQVHFPQLVAMAQRKANAIKKPDVLQALVLDMVAAQTEEQARQLLQSSKAQKQKP